MANKRRRAKKARKEAVNTISQRDLRALVQQCSSYEDRAATANGHSGELIREAVQTKNLHRGAFAVIKRLHRMGRIDSEKLRTMLEHLDDYRMKLGLDQMARAQRRFDDADETNVTRMKARVVEEEAGEAAE
jgi:hypothetical protein